MTPTEPPAFTEIVAELERVRGRPLCGRGRTRCLEAFMENERGFRVIARDAQDRARANALGLLCVMVDDGDHRLADVRQLEGAEQAPISVARGVRRRGRCVVCDQETEDALVWGAQFWCHEHEGLTG